MQGQKDVIKALNQVLGQSLVAINQYFLHARIAKNWGVEGLNESFYHQSIAEMKWADELIERILLLEGLPNLQELGKLLIGEDVTEMLECDRTLTAAQLTVTTDAIAICEQHQDYVSRELLTKQHDAREEYADWLDTQKELIGMMGIENYIQAQLDDD